MRSDDGSRWVRYETVHSDFPSIPTWKLSSGIASHDRARLPQVAEIGRAALPGTRNHVRRSTNFGCAHGLPLITKGSCLLNGRAILPKFLNALSLRMIIENAGEDRVICVTQIVGLRFM